jgi:hypothetical protein
MVMVRLCGGTNAGRVLSVKHGSSVRLPKRPPASYADTGEATSQSAGVHTETYQRPTVVLSINGIEQWPLADRE